VVLTLFTVILLAVIALAVVLTAPLAGHPVEKGAVPATARSGALLGRPP
jgi:hypothetical protein